MKGTRDTEVVEPEQPTGARGLDQADRDVVERFFAASERGDLAALETLVDDGMVMAWPQSGEVFRGRENVLGAMASVEVKPEFAGRPELVGSGHHWVMMAPLRYGTDVLHYVAVLEVRGGRISRGTGYWGAPFPAQASRASFADHRQENVSSQGSSSEDALSRAL